MQLPKFNLTPGYDTMTKDGIDARRRMIAGLARQQQPKTALEGVGRIAQALFARHAGAKLDEREGVLRKEADDMFQQAIGGFAGGMPAQTGTGFVPQGGGGSDMLTGGSGDDMLMPNVPVPGPQPLGRGGSEQMPQTLLPGAPQGDMASYVRNGLIERGLQPHIADGFVMNFQDESGLNPGINEIEPLVPGSRGGFGLSQWTGPRRRNLEAFAQSRGVPVGDADMQMDFLMDELRGPEAAAAQAIMAAPDAGQAAAAIVNKFLRPAEEHRARRERRYLGGQAPVTGGGGTPSLTGQSAGDTLQNFNPAQVMALAQAASNPMMTDGQRMVLGALLQRQLAPAQQVQPIEVNGQLVNPQTGQVIGDYRDQTGPAPITVNGQLVNPQTGKVLGDYRDAPAAPAQTLTDEEETQLGLNPAGVYQRSPDGTISTVQSAPDVPADPTSIREYSFYQQQEIEQGRQPLSYNDWNIQTRRSGANSVNVNSEGETAFQKETGKALAQEAATVVESGSAAQRNMGDIEVLEGLIAQTPQGLQGRMAQIAGSFGIKTEGSSDIEAMQAIVARLVPLQRPPGSGQMSDRDVQLFMDSLPSLMNTPEGNRKIVSTLRAIAEYDVARGQVARDLQLGRITPSEADERYRGLGNPISGMNGTAAQTGSGEAPAAGENPYIGMSDEDFSRIDISTLTAEQIDQLFEARGQ